MRKRLIKNLVYDLEGTLELLETTKGLKRSEWCFGLEILC